MQTIKLVPVTRPRHFVQAFDVTGEDPDCGVPRGRFATVAAVQSKFPDAMIGLPAPMPVDALSHATDAAWAFVRVLSEWLTPEQMHMVAAVNHDNGVSYPCCASHDYCDANMAMDEALQSVFGLNLFELSSVTWSRNECRAGDMSEMACELWDRAWNHGKTIIETFYLLPE